MKIINRLSNLCLYSIGFLSIIMTSYVGNNGCIWFLYEPELPDGLSADDINNLNKEFLKKKPI